MSVAAAIKLTQGANTDLPGRSLIGDLSGPVNLSNGDNTNVVDWTWTVIDVPPPSAVPLGVLAAGFVPTTSFTPDVPGGYEIDLVVKDALGVTARDRRVFQVPEPNGLLIPPFLATDLQLNFAGETRGWSPIMEGWLHILNGISALSNATQLVIRAALTRNAYNGGAADTQFTDTLIVATTDATPQLAYSDTLQNGNEQWDVGVVGVRDDVTEGCEYKVQTAFRNNAGAVVQRAVTFPLSNEDDATCDVQIDFTGTTGRVFVQGPAAKNYTWYVVVQRQRLVA